MSGAVAELEQGRGSYAACAWVRAHDALTAADETERLGAADLELLARAASMLGRDEDYVAALERAHDAHLKAGAPLRSVRCAFWIGHNMLFRGEIARARGWFARAQRQLDRDGSDCVERGWLLVASGWRRWAPATGRRGTPTAAEAAAIGERFGDTDLVWLARDEQGSDLGGSR